MLTPELKVKLELALWRQAARQLPGLVKQSVAAYRRIADLPCKYAYFDPWRNRVIVGPPDSVRNAPTNAQNAPTNAQNAPNEPAVEVGTAPTNLDGYVVLKAAQDVDIALPEATNAYERFQNLFGGSGPLASLVMNELAMVPSGYGLGLLLERLFPTRYVRRGNLPKQLALIGAVLGAGPAAVKWYANAADRAEAGQAGLLKALLSPDASTPITESFKSVYDLDNPRSLEHRSIFRPGTEKLSEQILAGIPSPAEEIVRAARPFLKVAFGSTGADTLPSIPVDAFNNAIWNDVRKGMTAATNPFGARNRWGDNEQPMHTPPAIGAAATGIVDGISSMYGGTSVLHPKHMIKGLVAAGVNLATAKMAGGILGALGILTPEAQNKLQDMGLWGGFVSGAVKSIFGR